VYKLVSGTGNIDVAVPALTLARFKARSVKGKVDSPIVPVIPGAAGFAPGQGNSLLRNASAEFEIRSFRGNISLRGASK